MRRTLNWLSVLVLELISLIMVLGTVVQFQQISRDSLGSELLAFNMGVLLLTFCVALMAGWMSLHFLLDWHLDRWTSEGYRLESTLERYVILAVALLLASALGLISGVSFIGTYRGDFAPAETHNMIALGVICAVFLLADCYIIRNWVREYASPQTTSLAS